MDGNRILGHPTSVSIPGDSQSIRKIGPFITEAPCQTKVAYSDLTADGSAAPGSPGEAEYEVGIPNGARVCGAHALFRLVPTGRFKRVCFLRKSEFLARRRIQISRHAVRTKPIGGGLSQLAICATHIGKYTDWRLNRNVRNPIVGVELWNETPLMVLRYIPHSRKKL